MTASAWNWILAIVGTVASIAGVIFSWMAWVQARKAKDAAREAADAVRTRNFSHDFSRWSKNAQELLQAVRELRFENAQGAATDLLGVLAHNKGWQAGLRREAFAVKVDEVIRLLTLVNTYLTERAVFEGKQSKIAEHCQVIFRRLSEISGSFDAEVENL
jgi:GTPase